MYQQYKQVIYDYREFLKRACTSRTIFQDKRIEELALTDSIEAYSIRKNIKNLEVTRSQHRKIQAMLGNRRGTGVKQVQMVDHITNITSNCTTKNEVEKVNNGYLPALFMCADNTHLRSSPLVEEFGYTGDTTAGDEVTAGTYVPPHATDEYTKLFLKCMKRPDHVPESSIAEIFSTDDYVNKWKCR